MYGRGEIVHCKSVFYIVLLYCKRLQNIHEYTGFFSNLKCKTYSET